LCHGCLNSLFQVALAPNYTAGYSPSREFIDYKTPLREFIDYKTSMITDEDPLRGLLFY